LVVVSYEPAAGDRTGVRSHRDWKKIRKKAQRGGERFPRKKKKKNEKTSKKRKRTSGVDEAARKGRTMLQRKARSMGH